MHITAYFHAHNNISLIRSLCFFSFLRARLPGRTTPRTISRVRPLKGNYLRPFSIGEKRTVGSYRLIRYTLLGSEHFAREGEGLLEQVEYDRNKPLYNAYTLLIHQLQNIHKLNNESAVLDISDPIRLRPVINPARICSSVLLCWHRCTWHPPKSHLNLNFVFVFIPALTQCPLFL